MSHGSGQGSPLHPALCKSSCLHSHSTLENKLLAGAKEFTPPILPKRLQDLQLPLKCRKRSCRWSCHQVAPCSLWNVTSQPSPPTPPSHTVLTVRKAPFSRTPPLYPGLCELWALPVNSCIQSSYGSCKIIFTPCIHDKPGFREAEPIPPLSHW